MKIAIIGAGGAGLGTAKCFQDENLEFDIYEQTDKIGGTWNYYENTGTDEYGLPIHSSMYKNLTTNLPKEVMAMEGLPYIESIPKSYVSHEEVLEYILSYARLFKLEKYIQFLKEVQKVTPTPDKKGFMIKIRDLRTDEINEVFYTHVIVCNGHYTEYSLPKFEDIESFSGEIKHSHNYRIPEPYADKTVLIVGVGPSGLNISQDIATVANKTFLSANRPLNLPLESVILKSPIKRISGKNIEFEDDTEEEVDEIIFCTGYDYSFPFLDPSCGVEIAEGKYVHPLYKQIINARNPRMSFIGLPYRVCPFPLFSLQARFVAAVITGRFELPSEEEMLKDVEEFESKRYKAGTPVKHYHNMDKMMGEYFDEVADTAGIPRLPPVINKLYLRITMDRNSNHRFKILDDENFVQLK